MSIIYIFFITTSLSLYSYAGGGMSKNYPVPEKRDSDDITVSSFSLNKVYTENLKRVLEQEKNQCFKNNINSFHKSSKKALPFLSQKRIADNINDNFV